MKAILAVFLFLSIRFLSISQTSDYSLYLESKNNTLSIDNLYDIQKIYFKNDSIKIQSLNPNVLHSQKLTDVRKIFFELTITTSFIEKNNTNKLNVFPNPMSTNIQIVFPEFYSEIQLDIYQITGEHVYETVLTNSNLFQFSRTLPNNFELKSGTYLIKAQTSNFSFYEKFIVY